MRHAKSRLVESRSACPDIGDPDISGDADESAQVRLGNLDYRGRKIRAMPLVGAVFNRTGSACPDYRDPDLSGLETAPTKPGGRKCLFIFRDHYNFSRRNN